MRTILHIDFNSYFATVEQQANPRLRGKPIGVTGGDRMQRTVIGAASVEAKRLGVKTGMQLWQAKKLAPSLILVPGDSDKYLYTTTRFLSILKDYSPYLEVFSIDEAFLELSPSVIARSKATWQSNSKIASHSFAMTSQPIQVAQQIKQRIRSEIGEWVTCSIGISYNKVMAKLAGSLYKPNGLVWIADEESAMKILDCVPLDEICGLGPRIKNRLAKLGIFTFKQLREVPLGTLLFEFKSYGQWLYDIARGIDHDPIVPFYEKEGIKSVGHRHTIDHDTQNPEEIKQILLKLTELIARRLRSKKLVGKTVICYYRNALDKSQLQFDSLNHSFSGDGMQITIPYTSDGLEIFKAGWRIWQKIWPGSKIRMIGATVSNLKPEAPQTLSLLPEDHRQDKIIQTLDTINNKYGEFTLQRGILLSSAKVYRKPNPFLSDRRFKL